MIYGKGMKNMFENAHDLYKSKEWKNLLQTLKLERVNESGKLLCEYCGEEIVKAYDCIGHHKIPLNNKTRILTKSKQKIREWNWKSVRPI